jgi:hypothetical protein
MKHSETTTVSITPDKAAAPVNSRRDPARYFAFALLGFGLSVHSYTAFIKADGGASGFVIGLWAWALVTYGVGAVLLSRFRNSLAAVGWLILPAIMDLITYRSVFVSPQSSTAALGLLFAPLWNLLLLGPIGGVIGWLASRRVDRRR